MHSVLQSDRTIVGYANEIWNVQACRCLKKG